MNRIFSYQVLNFKVSWYTPQFDGDLGHGAQVCAQGCEKSLEWPGVGRSRLHLGFRVSIAWGSEFRVKLKALMEVEVPNTTICKAFGT